MEHTTQSFTIKYVRLTEWKFDFIFREPISLVAVVQSRPICKDYTRVRRGGEDCLDIIPPTLKSKSGRLERRRKVRKLSNSKKSHLFLFTIGVLIFGDRYGGCGSPGDVERQDDDNHGDVVKTPET